MMRPIKLIIKSNPKLRRLRELDYMEYLKELGRISKEEK